MRLSDLLFKAGGLYDPDWRKETYLERAELIRIAPDEITRTIDTFHLGRVLDGDPSEDRLLRSDDHIRIYSIYSVETRKYADIIGEINTPGNYEIEENTTSNDLIIRAGGLTREAWPVELQVSRVYPGATGEDRQTFLITVPIDTTFTGRGEGLTLKDFDLVIVRRKPFWELQRNVYITGEVTFPGIHTLMTPDERMVSVIERAGGLTPYAYAEGARLIRSAGDAGLVGIDLERALQNPGSRSNLVMMAGDSLYVPEYVPTVRVLGAVEFQNSVLHIPGKPPRYYINRAGGFADGADRKRTYVVRANGSVSNGLRISRGGVRPGSTIYVPTKTGEAKDVWEVIRDTTGLISNLTMVLLLLWQISR
jgi:protein involved in polysaccharide export with SLBB domain